MPTVEKTISIVPSDTEISLDAVLDEIKIRVRDGVTLEGYDIQIDKAQVVLTYKAP